MARRGGQLEGMPRAAACPARHCLSQRRSPAHTASDASRSHARLCTALCCAVPAVPAVPPAHLVGVGRGVLLIFEILHLTNQHRLLLNHLHQAGWGEGGKPGSARQAPARAGGGGCGGNCGPTRECSACVPALLRLRSSSGAGSGGRLTSRMRKRWRPTLFTRRRPAAAGERGSQQEGVLGRRWSMPVTGWSRPGRPRLRKACALRFGKQARAPTIVQVGVLRDFQQRADGGQALQGRSARGRRALAAPAAG